jgi:hypothetical protein
MMSEGLGKRPEAVGLLALQTFAHGLVCIFTIVPAAGLFLSFYGAARLPYVYIVVGLIGLITTPIVSRALHRKSVASVAMPIVAGFAVLHLGCWMGIRWLGYHWPAFVLQLLLPMTLQLGFLFVSTQAGQLLTVREMKAWFSRIACGFALAMLIGGLIAPQLVQLFQATEHLLPLTAAAACGWCAVLHLTNRRFRATLAPIPQPLVVKPQSGSPLPPATKRLVTLIFLYQLGASLGTQLGEFFLFDRAGVRYHTSNQLGRFAADFNVGLNLFQLIFLFVAAGALVARFGMRIGLLAKPIVLVLGFGAASVLAPIMGPASSVLLLIAVVSRNFDITFTNSITRTATNTAYQALPVDMRATIQARLEGVAVPGAIGLTGILLLLLQRLNSSVAVSLVISAATSFVWLVCAVALDRQYRRQLHQNLETRLLSSLSHDADPLVFGSVGASTVSQADDVDLLLELIHHESREVRSDAYRRLHGSLDRNDERRPTLVNLGLGQVIHEATAICSALLVLTDSPQHQSLRLALLDEAVLCRDASLRVLALTLGTPTTVKARMWLRSDQREAATAIETLEVNAPLNRRKGLVGVLELPRDPQLAARQLRSIGNGSNVPTTETDLLLDLRDDPHRVWNSRWLRICAAEAIDSRV